MNPVWKYLITLFNGNEVREVLLLVDLNQMNEIEKEWLIYYGEYEKELLDLIKKNSFISKYEKFKIHKCVEVNYEIAIVKKIKED